MNTREGLAQAVCCGAPDLCEFEKGNRRNCDAEFCGDHVDAILDELMEPGEGARKIMLQARAEYAGGTWDGMEAHCWEAMLTAIREGK